MLPAPVPLPVFQLLCVPAWLAPWLSLVLLALFQLSPVTKPCSPEAIA